MLTDVDLEKISHLFDDRFERIDKRFAALETHVAAESSYMRTKFDDMASNTAREFESIKSKLNDMTNHSAREFALVHDRLNKLHAMESEDIEPIYNDITDLKQRITHLEQSSP